MRVDFNLIPWQSRSGVGFAKLPVAIDDHKNLTIDGHVCRAFGCLNMYCMYIMISACIDCASCTLGWRAARSSVNVCFLFFLNNSRCVCNKSTSTLLCRPCNKQWRCTVLAPSTSGSERAKRGQWTRRSEIEWTELEKDNRDRSIIDRTEQETHHDTMYE